ncbi:MAG: hypothetical protein ACO4CT_00245 [Planctomycetota bacterium]
MKRRAATLGLLACTACAGFPANDVVGIADQAPLPYSVFVTGGSFLELDSGAAERAVPRTFLADSGAELIPLQQIGDALSAGRVFVRTVVDTERASAARAQVAEQRADLPLDADAVFPGLLTEARAAGHDFVVVVQRVSDGPIEEYGINDRWPLTASLWILVGLGIFIPDHTFESRATLQAGVYEVQTGRLVHRAVGAAGPVDLSLVDRGSAVGFLQSIIVPPFWVSTDEDRLVERVGRNAVQRLVSGLARQLKSPACRQDLAEGARARIEFLPDGRVRVRSAEPLGAAALRVDGVATDTPSGFASDLLSSEAESAEDGFVYVAEFSGLRSGRFLQVLVRTVSGEVASVTLDREER